MRKLLLIPLLLVMLLGCDALTPPTAVEQFEAEIRNLEEAWQLGRQTRQSLQSKQLPVDRNVCRRMYQDTNADQAVEPTRQATEGFVDKHRAYYINGCLGIGKPLPAGSPAPTPTSDR